MIVFVVSFVLLLSLLLSLKEFHIFIGNHFKWAVHLCLSTHKNRLNWKRELSHFRGKIYSSIMKMHFGLSALALFWFQCSRTKFYKLARKLKITSKTHTHTRMFIGIMFDCSTPDPILSSSIVFYCVVHCFIDFSVTRTSYFFLLLFPSSYSSVCFCRWFGLQYTFQRENQQ